jgi:type III restriction enzyme
MENQFLQNTQKKVIEWREGGYKGIEKETENILAHIKRVGFLHSPQIEALETYIYLKEVAGNKPSGEIFRTLFADEREMLLALVSKDKAFDLIGDTKAIDKLIEERFGKSDYVNQVYALTMGSGKTILMATMCLYDFVLAYYHPDDKRFAKNALVFAPDTTIIESLKEIKTFDYSKVLPKEYHNILLNIKYHYLESTDTALAPIGNYNIIVTNSQKIILKTRNGNGQDGKSRLFGDTALLEKREIENARLQAIRGLEGLAIFVDEAHHSYGTTLEGTLKKTRQTIEYLHSNTPLVGVINLTGTPYVNNVMIDDVVYHFGLKTGIERGILKQVRILDYGEVKSEQFIQEVIDTFWDEYGEKRLEGRLPKIAFYAANIADLQEELKPKLEKVLASKGISFEKILEYHTEAESGKEEFLNLDRIESRKQFVLLVGKGTEGWNCRSLCSVALFKKPKSTILVLQSTTRCLRAIGDNSTVARIFVSSENYRILDRELKNNFAMGAAELEGVEQETNEHTLTVEKKKRLIVKKILKEIVSISEAKPENISLNLKQFKPDEAVVVTEGGIELSQSGVARYLEARSVVKTIEEKGGFTHYEIVEIINRDTHLPCSFIETVFEANKLERKGLVKKINDNPKLLAFLSQSILAQVYQYEEKQEIVEEEIELTKFDTFHLNVQKNREPLVVYREKAEEGWGESRIGFHINPYNFDSGDEKDLFKHLYQVLDADEAVTDAYFTGGLTHESQNDFYVEYWSPEHQRMAKYFPDFLIETTKGRYLVVEVKNPAQKQDYEANKVAYKGSLGEITNEVFAKELGFQDFQKINDNFAYHLIFGGGLQQQQGKVMEELKKAEK